MTSTITATRAALGWSMRDLADHLGVNVSTVSRMEASERDGTIKLATLHRALQVMGRTVRLEAVPSRREERVTLELHRAVVRKLRRSPSDVLRVVPENLDRLRRTLVSPVAQSWVDEWSRLVTRPVEELAAGMLADTPLGRELRQNSPFGGALSPDERREAIENAQFI